MTSNIGRVWHDFISGIEKVYKYARPLVMYGNYDVIDVGVSAHGDEVEACVGCLYWTKGV